MDNLSRVPKDKDKVNNSKISNISIRFNAADEQVQTTTTAPPPTAAESLNQTQDDTNWRKEFLSTNFFSRKRSGSIEGDRTSLIGNCSNSPNNDIGTWKLFKGKVSQAMEDIKSTKLQQQQQQQQQQQSKPVDDDSDGDTTVLNNSINDELDVLIKKLQTTLQPAGGGSDTDSDDIYPDLFDDDEISKLRKSFANLRSKAKSKLNEENLPKTLTASLSSSFLRKRKNETKSDKFIKSTTSAVTDKPLVNKNNFEIESGIEMFEDSIMNSLPSINGEKNDGCEDNLFKISVCNDTITFHPTTTTSTTIHDNNNHKVLNNNNDNLLNTTSQKENTNGEKNQHQQQRIKLKFLYKIYEFYKNFQQFVILIILILLFFMNIHDYLRGIITCILVMQIFNNFYEYIYDKLCKFIINNPNGAFNMNEQIKFIHSSPIQIPNIEEHKPLKTYGGWMNEINNYDPDNYHISATRSIYVRLDGPLLQLTNTTTRIPKRTMWNEICVERKNVKFTDTRFFNLLGCQVDLLPRGLAKKRYFSRKYPIQLIVKPVNNLSELETLPTVSNFKDDELQTDNELDKEIDINVSTIVLNSDLQQLNKPENENVQKIQLPCGDETRILLFARCDREKEDWYRRFYSASIGDVNDQELRIPDCVMITDEEVAQVMNAVADTSATTNNDFSAETSDAAAEIESPSKKTPTSPTVEQFDSPDSVSFEGLMMSSCAARNSPEFIRFMSRYQKACTKKKIPVIKKTKTGLKSNRRQKRQEDELWKGIDPTLYLGPSGSVVWANVLIGRILFSCLNDQILLRKIQEFLQKKLSAIKLPSFMEDVSIAQVHLGDTPPLIHRVSQPQIDERGTWLDADISYEGLVHMTVTTKLNLLRLKRSHHTKHSTISNHNDLIVKTSQPIDDKKLDVQQQQHQQLSPNIEISANVNSMKSNDTNPNNGGSSKPTTKFSNPQAKLYTNTAIYDSDAESSGASSSDSECHPYNSNESTATPTNELSGTSSRRLLRIVDRITASNLFQSATEISYIQRAMENMSTKITLRIELKGLVSRIVINIPPPPSDRIWVAFRGPPRLLITAKPAVGDHTFDWSIVTNVIESKLCDEVYKYLVYPNMVDIIVPFLGEPTYKE